MGEEAPLLPLCATQNTGSRPIQLFTKLFRKECSPKLASSILYKPPGARRGSDCAAVRVSVAIAASGGAAY